MAPVVASTWTRPATGISAVPRTEAVPYILADQSPQAMADKYNRSFILRVSIRCDVGRLGHPTVPSLSRYDERDASKFHAWLAIRFYDTTPRQSATYAS